MKRCPQCDKDRPLDAFTNDRSRPDGRSCWCRGCQARKGREYRQKPKARETAAGRMRRWREANPEQNKAADRRSKARRVDAAREEMRRWRLANREHEREAERRRWHTSGAKAESCRRYRARKLDAYVAPVCQDAILQRDLGLCGICGGQIMGPFHIDHIVPLARGGTHEPANCQLAHPSCNSRKGARLTPHTP